jgi:protein O-GlcNAc transferase
MAPFPLSEIVGHTSRIGILDVGAMHTENPTYLPLLRSGAARLIGFEADPAECEKLKKLYPAPSQFFPYFIGDGSAATFYETNWSATGSLFKPNKALLEQFHDLHEVVTRVGARPVQTTRLDDVEGIGEVDFIKLDIQGAELMALQNAERLLKDTSAIQVEVEFLELYEGQPLFADVDRFLRGQGFVLHTFLGFGSRCFKPLVRRGVKQVLWSDAVYVRDWANLEAMPGEKLIKYATLVHHLFESPDLCALLLERLDAKAGTKTAQQYAQRLLALPRR